MYIRAYQITPSGNFKYRSVYLAVKRSPGAFRAGVAATVRVQRNQSVCHGPVHFAEALSVVPDCRWSSSLLDTQTYVSDMWPMIAEDHRHRSLADLSDTDVTHVRLLDVFHV